MEDPEPGSENENDFHLTSCECFALSIPIRAAIRVHYLKNQRCGAAPRRSDRRI